MTSNYLESPYANTLITFTTAEVFISNCCTNMVCSCLQIRNYIGNCCTNIIVGNAD